MVARTRPQQKVRNIREFRAIKQRQEAEQRRLSQLTQSQRQTEIKRIQSSIISEKGLTVIERFADGSPKRAVKEISATSVTPKFAQTEVIFNKAGFPVRQEERQRFIFGSGRNRQGRIVDKRTTIFENGQPVQENIREVNVEGRITSNIIRDLQRGVQTTRETPASEVAGAEGPESAFNIAQQIAREKAARKEVLTERVREVGIPFAAQRKRAVTLAEKIIAAREPKKGKEPIGMRSDALSVSAVFDPKLFGTEVRPSDLKQRQDITSVALTPELISQLEKGQGTPIQFKELDLPPKKRLSMISGIPIADIPESQFRLAPTFEQKVLFFGPREGEGNQIQRFLQRGEAVLRATASEARELRLKPSEDLNPIQEFAKDVGAAGAEFGASAAAGAIKVVRDPFGTAVTVVPIVAATALGGPVAGAVVATAPSFIQTGLGQESDISRLITQVKAQPISVAGEIAGQAAIIIPAVKGTTKIGRQVVKDIKISRLERLPKGTKTISQTELDRILSRGGIKQPKGELQTTFDKSLRTITQDQAARFRAFLKGKSPLKGPTQLTQFVVQQTGPGTDIVFLQKATKTKPLTKFGVSDRSFRIIRGRAFAQRQRVKFDTATQQTRLVEPTVAKKPPKPMKPFLVDELPKITRVDQLPPPFKGDPLTTSASGLRAFAPLKSQPKGPTIIELPPTRQTIQPPINVFEELRGFQSPGAALAPTVFSESIIGAIAVGVPKDKEDIKQIPGTFTIQTPDVTSVEREIQIQKPAEDLRQQVEDFLKEDQRIKPSEEIVTKQVPEVIIGTPTPPEEEQITIPDVVIIPEVVPDTTPDITQPPDIIIPEVPPQKEQIGLPSLRFPEETMVRRPEQLVEAYDTLTRRKKRDVQRNRRPLSKRGALNMGARIVDNTTDVSFKIRRRGKKVPKGKVRDVNDGYFAQNKSKFRDFTLKQRGRKLKNTFIEKNKFRIDSPGERRQLSAARFLKPKKRRFI